VITTAAKSAPASRPPAIHATGTRSLVASPRGGEAGDTGVAAVKGADSAAGPDVTAPAKGIPDAETGGPFDAGGPSKLSTDGVDAHVGGFTAAEAAPP
jgi:hypothetical protein